MILRLFGRSRYLRQTRRDVVDAIYGKIVATARQPAFYSHWQVPDTPLGRFEMMALHVFLFMHRMRGEAGGAAAELTQAVIDEFFKDVEHSLRELGIGDMGVPKRMKKLARMFYGRAAAYGDALDTQDREALADALRRNVVPERADWPQASNVADHAFSAHDVLAHTATDTMLRGDLPLPLPREEGGRA